MDDALLKIKAVISHVHPLPADAWDAFSGIWTSFSAKRKEIITTAGEKEKYLYIVLEGVQRVVYFDEQNREATLVFTYPPSFGGVLDSFLMQTASKYYYETLTPSSFLRTSFTELEKLMVAYPDIELLIRKGVTGALAGLLERITELQCFSSEEKFRKLLQRSPHILQLVPHKYLANYLGIDATNFSKMINRIKIT
ncbi:MAG: Crp/Fnr family transcriptional regulator [Agriterribacter sp.]